MDVDDSHDIGQQEMECEKSGRDKEVVHRMDVDLVKDVEGGYQDEEEQETTGCEKGDPRGQRPWVQLLRDDDTVGIERFSL